MGLRERNRSRTEADLAAAAVRLFTTRGYDATTVADIAEAADVSVRTFFRYFRAKEDVVFAGHDRYLAAMCETVTEAARDGDERGVLSAAVRRFARYVESHPDVGERLVLATTEERLFERLLAIRNTWEQALADALAAAKGREAGGFEERVVANAVLGALQVALEAWSGPNRRPELLPLVRWALQQTAPVGQH